MLIVLLSQCATRGSITGGPKDAQPPQLIEVESSPNFQTDFTERSLTLHFDEWIKLNDPFTQILISPPTERRPDVRVRGRAVNFTFHEDEVLREDATYSINFGSAIQDITESNPVQNYSFVFSTGSSIDSLSIGGMVVDAQTGEPKEEVTVMLYEENIDSIVFQSKPFYAARTLKNGSFQINNVKSGAFKMIAIADENLNYLWDPPAEPIAFLDTLITISADSSASVKLIMSAQLAQLQMERIDTSGWNLAIIPYNRSPEEIDVSFSIADSLLYVWREGNQLWVYQNPQVPNYQAYLTDLSTLLTDTLKLRPDRSGSPATLGKKSIWKNSYHPAEPIRICFDRPITSVQQDRIVLLEGKDSIRAQASVFDSIPLCIEFSNPWKADSTYRLTILPGALTDFYGASNDTIAETFPIANPDRFGTIILQFDNLEPQNGYVFELGKDKGKVLSTFLVQGDSTLNRTIERMKPGKYTLRVIEDRNLNGHWDPAEYMLGEQPEKLLEFALEELRANWDLEVKHAWK